VTEGWVPVPSTEASGTRDVDVLVVGAGMAGLTAATELHGAGRSVLTVDKGNGVGGRMASRRIGPAVFDHGAQFVTTRDPRFAAAMAEWERRGVVREWCRGFAGAGDGHSRWCAPAAMTSIPKELAAPLDVMLDTRLVSLRVVEGRWRADTQDGLALHARAVVLTPPVPQSLALLDAGNVALPPHEYAELSSITYECCLAVMAVLEGPSQVPPPGGLAPGIGPVAWIADNQAKGISGVPSVTIHATDAFSRTWWDRDRQEAGRELLHASERWLGGGVVALEVHGWRYSKPVPVAHERRVVVLASPPLAFAGDAFGSGRVEGAALSGWEAAAALLRLRT
jgi:renalase